MKMGFITSLLDGWSYEEMMDEVARIGIQCVEVACWPKGKAERKYGGVTHIEIDRVLEDDEYARHILDYAKEKGVDICALAYYPNNLDPDPERRKVFNEHLVNTIHAAAKLGVPKVTTFIGRVTNKTFEENLEMLPEVWNPILEVAEQEGILVCIENCPMLFDATNWPGGQNIMTSPANWERVFEVLPSKNLGLALDPSHFVWQMIDCGEAIRAFRDRIYHVHLKDIKFKPEELARRGVMAYPLDIMDPKIPGYGDVNWSDFISQLTMVGYNGDCCLEIEDRFFEDTREHLVQSIELAKRYMDQFII
ncbi:sugar phosphate isomerase/epimerase family protein [Enorma massiliensis]|uniref:sugar phosphate isomerase/epimerase family protein n=1 Tax=Enorma massiliensis TaxID=1472761 RepID=UPI0034A0D711